MDIEHIDEVGAVRRARAYLPPEPDLPQASTPGMQRDPAEFRQALDRVFETFVGDLQQSLLRNAQEPSNGGDARQGRGGGAWRPVEEPVLPAPLAVEAPQQTDASRQSAGGDANPNGNPPPGGFVVRNTQVPGGHETPMKSCGGEMSSNGHYTPGTAPDPATVLGHKPQLFDKSLYNRAFVPSVSSGAKGRPGGRR